MKYGFFLICFLLFVQWTTPLIAQQNAVEWLSIEEVTQKLQEKPKKVIVKIYVEDCVWCKRMDEETFEKSFVADYINTHFYAVALDANSTEDIQFKDRIYQYVKNGKRGHHELAAELTKGNLSYPSVVFLDENMKILQSVSGYKEYDLFQKIMNYYGQNFHTKVPWSSFQNTFVPIKD